MAFESAPNFEAPSDANTDNAYLVVIRATDIAGNTTDQSITVTVTDANEAPALVGLNGLTVPENARSGIVLGRLHGTDPDRGDSLQYRLVTGVADNASFEVQGDRLLSRRSFDFETQHQYRLRVSAMDRGGLSAEREVLVSVTDENDPPRLAGEIESLSGVYREAFQWDVPATAFTDPDAGQTLQFTLSGLPRGLIFDPLNRTVRGMPEQVGNYSLTLAARDSGVPSATVTAEVRLVILPTQAQLSIVDWEQTYDGRPKQGGMIAVEGEWVVYRPASDLPEGAVDRFSYEIRQGGETARAWVLLMAQSWTTGTQQCAAQLLPLELGIQLRFRTQPSHRFRVLSSASLQAPLVWEE